MRLAAALAITFLAAAGAAGAEEGQLPRDVVQRLRDLEEQVRTLERRLAELEGRQPVPPPPEPAEAPKVDAAGDGPTELRTRWDDGLVWKSRDGAVDLRLGGRFETDWAFFSEDDDLERAVGGLSDGVEIRRLRLGVEGTLYRRLSFEVEVELAGSQVELKDGVVELERIPGLTGLRLGHFKEPFSLEEVSASRQDPLMERSLVAALAPSRNVGVMARGVAADRRMTWAAGAFRETDDGGRSDEGSEGWNVTARVTGLPWRRADDRLVHVGVAHSWRKPDASRISFEREPDSNLAPPFVRTGVVPLGGDVELFGAELAVLHGPWSLQAEHVRARADALVGAPLDFSADSALVAFYLTGESRNYRSGEGSFGSTSPRRPFLARERGPGAWELAARWSRVDLTERFVRGGRLEDLALGVNWHLSRNARFSWNLVHADLEGVGTADIVQLRVALSF